MGTQLKFILTFILGIFTGFLMCVFALSITSSKQSTGNNDIVMFDKPSQVIDISEFKVMQVLPDGSALATSQDLGNMGTVALFMSKDGVSYYDDQSITAPYGKCFKQVGTFRYLSRQDFEKTVPIVEIMDR